HHALVGLPALPGDELDQRARPLPAAEEQVEELVDERVVRRQRVAGQDEAGHPLQQAALEPAAGPLDHQAAEPVRKPGRELQRQRRALPPFTEGGGVVRQLGTARPTRLRKELRTTRRQPIQRCLHALAPLMETLPASSSWTSSLFLQKLRAPPQRHSAYQSRA